MIWALAALQAAVTLSWMAYAYHQPRLLARFGFEGLASLLGWYLVFAGTTLAPLAGDASDRLVRSGGDRLPVLRAGVALAAASFLAVALTARADAASPVRFVLPLFVAVWIAGMTVFQAPALAMLRDVEPSGSVAGAAAPLVVATVLPVAAWPLVESALERLGGSVTFLAGGIAVVATAALVGTTVDVSPRSDDPSDEAPTVRRSIGAFAGGVASAVLVLLATDLVPATIASRLGASAAAFAAIAGVVAALTAPIATRWSARVGAVRAVGASIVLGLACAGASAAVTTAPLAAIAAAGAGGALAVNLASTLPLALSLGARARAGLTTGLYVAGAVVGSRLPALVFPA